MRKGKVRVVAVILLLLLTGCITNGSSVLVSENVVPKDFHKIAFTPEKTSSQFLVMKATEQAIFNKLWNFYNFKGNVNDLDFDEKGAIFVATYESSCESVVSSIKKVNETIQIDIDSEMGTGGCAEIAIGRSFIIEWDKSDLNRHNSVVFMEGHNEIEVPFKQLAEIKSTGER